MEARFTDLATMDVCDFMVDIAKNTQDIIRAERALVDQNDGRECWRVDLWLTRPVTHA